ncbi:MAG: hypothetical protein MH321_17815 [Leptospiraceae bacterium]|nr:hypothetical protein [Leptospiraceae bacterium]
MKQKLHLIILYCALVASFGINFYLYKKDDLISVSQRKSEILSDTIIGNEPTKKKDLLSVYIMPHPPNFLEGRRLYFREYSIIESSGISKIIFQEKIGNKWQATEVDSEAVRWK